MLLLRQRSVRAILAIAMTASGDRGGRIAPPGRRYTGPWGVVQAGAQAGTARSWIAAAAMSAIAPSISGTNVPRLTTRYMALYAHTYLQGTLV